MKKSDLKYNIAALREFKQLTGISPFKLTNEEILDPDYFGALSYVGLKYGKYSDTSDVPSREEIEEGLSLKDAAVVWEAFAEWCNLGTDKEDDPKN
jgi:hypothetical protein